MKLKNFHLSTVQCLQETPLQASPKHQRVSQNRQINQINWAIQSVLTMGRMQKMELLTINNRLLNKRGKIKRNQWLTKTHKNSEDSFLPDIENLQADFRSEPKKPRKKGQRQETFKNKRKTKIKYELEDLIDQELRRIKEKGLLKGQYDRKLIVHDACQGIKKRIKSNDKTQMKHRLPIQEINLNCYKKKTSLNHKRAVTDVVYNQSISFINKREEAINKLRQRKKQDFLKKIKRISHTKTQH